MSEQNQFDLFGSLEPALPVEATPEPAPSKEQAVLPDAAARRRIAEDLDTNLLVEAGAGAGKTTAMVGRMVALVASGRAQVQQLAAVTFTRKAAAELRERFQTALERALHRAVEEELRARLDRALRDIDRAFLGTIHAFCARLLRERPLEAGLDPGFRETLGSEETRLRREFWLTHLERMAADGDARLGELADIGLKPQQLFALFEQLVGQPDVVFPSEPKARPDAVFMRRRIESIMDGAVSFMPAEEPAKGWDALQTTLRKLRFQRFVLGWTRDTRFLDAIGELRKGSFKATQNRWTDGVAAKAIQEELEQLFEPGGPAARLLRDWWSYRYPIALSFARHAADAYERERLRAGTLNFQDLLMFAARLLRESPAATRELGERYRYLLVDEFQDTDPVQAEVLFLLGSEPVDGVSWREAVPRPGALFVVGDPKQSIYRFRRADMALYAQVKRRFEGFGSVLELTANFRSGKAVETFVNDIFRERFPEVADGAQAGFAPMLVQRTTPLAGRTEGVFWYELDDPVHGKVPKLAEEDSARVATWIAQRVASGERVPGDFLVLTPNTRRLADYAAALEQRNIPVQVTGAGVGEDMHLRELRLVLRALADPGDPTLCVAVLVGLFYGIDYERLTQHAETWSPPGEERKRDPFAFTQPWEGESDVERALAALHRFWRWTRDEPVDIAVERIVDALGVLPLAAAGELGQTRAGALLFALDAIRAAALAGDSSITGALSALDTALDEDESEAPLEPGRTDVVRVMNLHKAKGLEAHVVVLAHPFGDWSPEPTSRVVRDESGNALGYTVVGEKRASFGALVTLAQPEDWEQHAAIEREFARAEDERLLYVAATRAGEELVVGMAYNAYSPSTWRSFGEWLKQNGTRLELPQPDRAERRRLQRSADSVMQEIAAVQAARASAGTPTYRAAPVTARKSEVGELLAAAEPVAVDGAMQTPPLVLLERHERGTEWGTLVHQALEAALEGAGGERLRALCRGWLVAAERPADASGEPLELDELIALVDAVRGSPVWQRATTSPQHLSEVPFALALDPADYARMAESVQAELELELVDGRIDLVFREADGWVIVDYKSDAAGARIPPELMRRYQNQVRLYGRIWERLTGEAVKERLLLFTAGGRAAAVNVN